jgi:hypothetical protein
LNTQVACYPFHSAVSPSKLPKTARLQQPPARKPRTLPAALALMDVSQVGISIKGILCMV